MNVYRNVKLIFLSQRSYAVGQGIFPQEDAFFKVTFFCRVDAYPAMKLASQETVIEFCLVLWDKINVYILYQLCQIMKNT